MLLIVSALSMSAKELYPDSPTASNEIELGVESIQNICYTGAESLDNSFCDVIYDKEPNTVVLTIQLASWNGRKVAITRGEQEAVKQAIWIVEKTMEGYNETKENHPFQADSEVMTNFYNDLVNGSKDRHKAFQYAKTQVRDKYPQPFYWAGFVMID